MYMCVCALLWLLWLPQESGQEETDAGGREEERVKVESKLDKRVQVRPHPHTFLSHWCTLHPLQDLISGRVHVSSMVGSIGTGLQV